MMTLIGHSVVYVRHHRAVVIARSVRALMLSGVSESTASVLANANRAVVVQLAQRLRLIDN